MKKPLVITAGEPAGVGPELCLALAIEDLPCRFVIVSDPALLAARARQVGAHVTINEIDIGDAAATLCRPGEINVVPVRFPVPPVCGRPDPANARALLDGLRLAASACLAGEVAALVTAPLQKSVINNAGIPFSGHTEFLAEITQTPMPVMMLVADKLRVALASTHLPLREVPDFITRQRLHTTLRVLIDDLRGRFGIEDPEVIVCGLNPHAGEGGHLGTEDEAIITPAIRQLAAEGVRVRGPMPADTAFTPAAGSRDAVLAMYHDQGLPVLKYAGFGRAVNVTLGLPIVRTSVDHGTALDIAGTGRADSGSLVEAIRLASELASR